MDLTPPLRVECSSLVRPCTGERVSGDAVVVRSLDDGIFAAIVDVLGHGPEAHELTHVIDEFLTTHATPNVIDLMSRLHRRVRGTRGAAVGMCAVDAQSGNVDYAGIGNTRIRRFGRSETRLVSHDGVLGQNMRTPQPQSLRLECGDVLLLYTDGINDRFTVADYPGVLQQPLDEVARVIVDRFGKMHDDAACIAIRCGA